MTSGQKLTGYYVWIGFALGSLFFYPISMTLGEEIYFLHWRYVNNLELGICWILLSIVFGLGYWVADLFKNIRVKGFAITSVILIPTLSFVIHFSRALGLDKNLLFLGEILRNYKILLIFLLVSVLVLIIYSMRTFIALEKKMVLILSPVTFVVVFNIATTFGHDEIVGFQGPNLTQTREDRNSNIQDIFIILFDEMSYQFLYEGNNIRSEFPNIRAFSEVSENYHEARSPGHRTLIAIPGLIKGGAFGNVIVRENQLFRKEKDGTIEKIYLDDKNIFSEAQEKGFNTLLIGWYHNYCKLLENSLDFCRAFSLYNYGATNNLFSLVNPIFTNISLWPSQFPFWLIKNPVTSLHQRNMVKSTLDLSLSSFDFDGPVFQFIHFSVPHVPFVFDTNKFHVPPMPFDVSSENYVKQLKFVDHVFGQIVDELKKKQRFHSSIIILLSDHNYRKMAKRKGWRLNQIPLIIKRSNQREKINLFDPVEAQTLLVGTLKNQKNMEKAVMLSRRD